MTLLLINDDKILNLQSTQEVVSCQLIMISYQFFRSLWRCRKMPIANLKSSRFYLAMDYHFFVALLVRAGHLFAVDRMFMLAALTGNCFLKVISLVDDQAAYVHVIKICHIIGCR